MRSFASLAAIASIAFATVASALPTVAGSTGLSRRDGLAEVETEVKNIATTANAANGLNAVVANAQSHQARYAPSPDDGYHADLVALVAQVTGLTKVEVLTKALSLEHFDLTHIDVKAIVALLPIDLRVVAIVEQFAPWVKVETIVQNLGNKIEILKDANINIANAQATQTANGGNYERDGLDAPAGPDAGAATGAAGAVTSVLGGLTQGKTARSEYRGIPDILVELKVKVQSLCDELNADISAAASASVALQVSLTILAEIKEHILNARAEIEAIVAAKFEGALCLNGKLLSVHAIAEIYASIVLAISVTLGLVVKACATVQTDVLIALIVDISVALAACITLGAKLAVGLIVDIRALIDVVVHIIVELKLEALIQVLQIGAGY